MTGSDAGGGIYRRSPFPPIADYGFLSDCESMALVAPSGNVEWMCLPRVDSPSVFASLLDRDADGKPFKDWQKRNKAREAAMAAMAKTSAKDRERLFGYLEGGGKMILSEPHALLTEASRMPGLDGQKMSKSYNNTVGLREAPDSVTKKIRTMPTDPARVKRTDPGEPEKCPVWQLHLIYSEPKTREWAQWGCRNAGIGCLECKQPVIDAVLAELAPMRDRAQRYLDDPTHVAFVGQTLAPAVEVKKAWNFSLGDDPERA